MDKVSIVILNYLNFHDTIQCVESIIIDKYLEREIIIVDNGSTNESRKVLEEKYREADRVHLLFSERNEGFARGNNIGIRYATEKLGSSFVLLVNNDTIFKDPLMLTKLMKAYEVGVGVIGPRIISADGAEQNPVRFDRPRGNHWQRIYYGRKIITIIAKQHALYQWLKMYTGGSRRKRVKVNALVNASQCSEDLVLHGACMLLTKDYFKYYPCLFPETFLYYEENILTMLTRKVRLKKKFVDSVYLYHKEDQSSEMSFGNDKKIKNKFLIESIKQAQLLYPLEYPDLKERYFSAKTMR